MTEEDAQLAVWRADPHFVEWAIHAMECSDAKCPRCLYVLTGTVTTFRRPFPRLTPGRSVEEA